MEERILQTYQYIEEYAEHYRLTNTLIVLPAVKKYMDGDDWTSLFGKQPCTLHPAYYRHSLSVARMLIDLHPTITTEELDLAVSASCCHILPELFTFEDAGEAVISGFHADPRIFELVHLITREDNQTRLETREFYDHIQDNKLALLIRITDRANLVEGLYDLSTQEAREYILETRKYFFPLCIYAKENFPELLSVVSLIMEKIRSLIDVTDILARRHQEHEIGLTREILELKEENAKLRSIIRQLQKEQMQE